MGGQSRLDIELFQNNLNVTTGWFVLRFLYRQNGSYCKAGGSAKRFCVELSRPLLKLSRTMLLISRWKMKPGDLELLDLARKSQCVRRPRANTRAWRRRKKTFPKRSRKKNKKKPCKRRRTLGAGLNKRKWKKGASLDLLLTPWQCIAGNCFLLPLSQKGNKYRLNHFPIFCQATAFFRKQMPTSLGYAFVFVAETLLKVGRYCELCATIQLTVMRLKTFWESSEHLAVWLIGKGMSTHSNASQFPWQLPKQIPKSHSCKLPELNVLAF